MGIKTARKIRRFCRRSLVTYKVLYKHYIAPVPWRRTAYSAACLAIFVSLLVPILEQLPPGWKNSKRYHISPVIGELIGQADEELSNKITYDSVKKTYIFNKEVMGEEVKAHDGNTINVGGGSPEKAQYAVELPERAKDGMKIYDSESKEFIKLIPQFDTMRGLESDERIVYPLGGIDGQKVYTVKKSGLKEDIVINKASGNELSFSYKLELPKHLEARLTGKSVGIYSADPTLFGNVTASTDADQELLQKARENGKKDNLLFMLPEPIIKENGNDAVNPKESNAFFELSGDTLTVKATNLENLFYPISIDPTVLVTSLSNFEYGGNDEGNTELDSTNNRIRQGGLTGGTTGAWANTSNTFTTGRYALGAAAYNGKMYVAGGCASPTADTTCTGTFLSDVQYATINSNGDLGSWSSTTSFTTGRNGHELLAYNGYLYIIGGCSAGNCTTFQSNVQYAPINSDGTVGTWTATSSLGTARYDHGAAAYNGYLYVTGGCSAGASSECTTLQSSVEYAQIRADGTLGSWATTTAFTNARTGHGTVAYNGFLYVYAGCRDADTFGGGMRNCDTTDDDVQYAPIASNGTVGTWTSESAASSNRAFFGSTVYNGYIYLSGGSANCASPSLNTSRYGSINADGSVGVSTTANMPLLPDNFISNAICDPGMVAYKGYLYTLGGNDGNGTNAGITTIRYAQIDPPGTAGSWVSDSGGTGDGSGRQLHTTVIYHNYMYVIGGSDTNTGMPTGDIRYALIASDGTVGAFSADANTMNVQYRALAGSFAYDGYLYILGGCNGGFCATQHNTIEYAPIGSSGALSADWSTNSTNLPAVMSGFGTAVYNGYVYVTGGIVTGSAAADTRYAQINTSTHQIGSWTLDTNTDFTTRANHQTVAYAGYLYVIGGENGAGTFRNDVYYAPIGNSGALTGAWTLASNTFTTARMQFGATIANGYMYVVGGIDSGSNYLTSVYYAKVETSGDVGTFTATESLPTGTDRMGIAFANGFLYTTGGLQAGTSVNTIYATPIGNGGFGSTTGTSFTSDDTFTTARRMNNAVAYNGYLYVLSGCAAVTGDGCTSFLSDVQYAQINADGSIGSWASAGASFTTGRRGGTAVAYNGYLYIMGGCSADSAGSGNCTNFQSSVEYAPINSNGTISSFASTNSFSTGRALLTGHAYNGYMYIMGGCSANTTSTCTSYRSDVQYATINSNGSLSTWTSTSSLNTGRSSHTSAVYNGYLYVMGGCTAGGLYGGCTSLISSVEYAALNSDGTAGTWAFTTSQPCRMDHARAVTLNGYLYALGGFCAGAFTDDVLKAPILPNGKIGNWENAGNMGVTRNFGGVATYNGQFYYVGGMDGGTLLETNTTYRAGQEAQPRIATYSRLVDFNEQSPAVSPNSLGSWASGGTNFTTGRWRNVSIAYNGYLYVLGGCQDLTACTTFLSDVQYAPINSNGTLGSWASTTSFTTGRYNPAVTVYNGYMYIMGGCSAGGCTTWQNDVQYAPINPNGTVGTWTSTNSFTTGRRGLGAIAYNGYMYVLGGESSGGTNNNDVQYAAINSNGTVGTWAATNSFTTARRQLAVAAYNGYMYILGGTTGGGVTNDVQYATINSNGTVSTWTATSTFTSARDSARAEVHNGYIYIMGGWTGADATSNVQYAPLNDSGTIGTWAATTSLSQQRANAGSAYYNGYLYAVGGCTTGNCTGTLLNSSEYVGIQNIGNNTTPNKISFNGTNTGNPGIGGIGGLGGLRVSYKFANNTCMTPTSSSTASAGLPPLLGYLFDLSGTADGCSISTQNYRYMLLTLKIDDSQTVTFPDTDCNRTLITDFDVYYSPNAAKRLRGGRTFTNQAQQSLDINQ